MQAPPAGASSLPTSMQHAACEWPYGMPTVIMAHHSMKVTWGTRMQVGISAMQKLMGASPALASRDEFRAIMNLKVGTASCTTSCSAHVCFTI